MIEINLHVLLMQATCFLITLWVLKKVAWGPIMSFLATREADIRSDYEKAETERRQMEELRQQYEQKIAGAEAEARGRINAALQRAEEQAGKILTQAQQDAQAAAERNRSEIERERQKVIVDLRGQVGKLSVAIAGKIIEEQLDEKKHQHLVDDFISRLGTLS